MAEQTENEENVVVGEGPDFEGAAERDGQPQSEADLHNPNKLGPSSAPGAGPQGLDPATQAALDPERANYAAGEASPPQAPGE